MNYLAAIKAATKFRPEREDTTQKRFMAALRVPDIVPILI